MCVIVSGIKLRCFFVFLCVSLSRYVCANKSVSVFVFVCVCVYM